MVAKVQTDDELWTLVKQDDHSAFEQLYLCFLKPIFIEVNKRVARLIALARANEKVTPKTVYVSMTPNGADLTCLRKSNQLVLT